VGVFVGGRGVEVEVGVGDGMSVGVGEGVDVEVAVGAGVAVGSAVGVKVGTRVGAWATVVGVGSGAPQAASITAVAASRSVKLTLQ
jgi:hypothetical protein